MDETELAIIKASRDQLSAAAAIRARPAAQLAVARVVERLFVAGLGLLPR